MKKLLFGAVLITFTLTTFGMNKENESGSSNNASDEDWKLVWSDEFNYSGLPDSAKWKYDVGGHGWGNNELQYYTGKRIENAYVKDGLLVIDARREDYEGKNYTSARLLSKEGWTYGKFEVSARLPEGRGTWPAVWMLPDEWNLGNGGWPDNGEIDIMEHVGFNPNFIHGSVHCRAYYWRAGTQKTDTVKLDDVFNTFHVYALEWNADSMSISVDGNKYFTFVNEKDGWEKWPFDKDFHFVLNVAVGGDWGGTKGVDESIWPQQMKIDYVRVYKKE
jgi:beta-glucanase (GH16 family)